MSPREKESEVERRAAQARLKAEMDAVADGFGGTLGYCLLDRQRPDRGFSRRGGERFPTASTIKMAILCAALHHVEQPGSNLTWDGAIPVTPVGGMREEGGPAFYFREGAALSLSEWLHLMICLSDNTATIVLRNRVGQQNVNAWLERHDLGTTRVLNGLETDALGLRALQQQYGLGVTTPDEMARLMGLILDGQAGSPAACERMVRLLSHQYWDDFTASQCAPTVFKANKTGAVDRSRSDIAYVRAPRGDYILSVYTREQQDTRWTVDNAGDVAIRKLAALVWRHYDPERTWTPTPDAPKFYPA